ncbi:putative membrane protein [Pseudomonas sp. TE3786]
MKDSIIKLNDTLARLAVILLVLFGLAGGASQGTGWMVVGGLIGFVIGALMSGVWFVLSGIYEQTAETNRHLKELLSSTNNVHAELETIKKLTARPSSD